MKPYAILLFFAFVSCDKDSSPEGRMQIKYDQLEQKIDSLANQNRAILDSLVAIQNELKVLKAK